ncbi:hypothetical protein I79_000069 [Cricetulus griseus]|uniref:Uncharacterized protein n=1 Tax=Cricetulus griseus TaxID=10029 RepID=G3GRC6_CRIGR|nr:hypothetical protein I79_000069 [Cricetulus griseus]
MDLDAIFTVYVSCLNPNCFQSCITSLLPGTAAWLSYRHLKIKVLKLELCIFLHIPNPSSLYPSRPQVKTILSFSSPQMKIPHPCLSLG